MNKYDILDLMVAVPVAAFTGIILTGRSSEKGSSIIPVLNSDRPAVVSVYIILALMIICSAVLSIRAEDTDYTHSQNNEKKHKWIDGNPKKVYNNICVISFFGYLAVIALSVVFQ